MKEEIIKNLIETIEVEPRPINEGCQVNITTIQKAAEQIEAMYRERNCGNCKYLIRDHWGTKCTCHELYMQNDELIKCNDWEGK